MGGRGKGREGREGRGRERGGLGGRKGTGREEGREKGEEKAMAKPCEEKTTFPRFTLYQKGMRLFT